MPDFVVLGEERATLTLHFYMNKVSMILLKYVAHTVSCLGSNAHVFYEIILTPKLTLRYN